MIFNIAMIYMVGSMQILHVAQISRLIFVLFYHYLYLTSHDER